MAAAHRRHDLTDEKWGIIEPLLPGQRGHWGGIAEDNRRFADTVFLIIRTGAPWRDLPPDYDGRGDTRRRFIRWRDKGTWDKVLEGLVDDPDFEWLTTGATHCRAHQGSCGARGGDEGVGRTKGGPTPRHVWPWMRMVCRSDSLPLRVPRRIADMQRA